MDPWRGLKTGPARLIELAAGVQPSPLLRLYPPNPNLRRGRPGIHRSRRRRPSLWLHVASLTVGLSLLVTFTSLMGVWLQRL